MMKTIFINYSERSSVTKMSQEPYCRSQDDGRESAVATLPQLVTTTKYQGTN